MKETTGMYHLQSLRGKTITADCLHPLPDVAQSIVEKGGHYCLQVKGNKNYLYAPIKAAFPSSPPTYGPLEKGHGRRELRTTPEADKRIGILLPSRTLNL